MTVHVRCTACNTKLLSFRSLGPEPVGRDTCPNCGGQSFVEHSSQTAE